MRLLFRIFAVFLIAYAAIPRCASAAESFEEQFSRLNQQAQQLYNEGHYSQSLETADQLLKLTQAEAAPNHTAMLAAPNNTTMLSALHVLAELYTLLNQYDKAEGILRQAIATLKPTVTAVPMVGDLQLSLGRVLYHKGDFGKAEVAYRRAREMYEGLSPYNIRIAWVLRAMSELYLTLRMHDESLEAIDRALDIIEFATAKDDPRVADVLDIKAQVHAVKGEIPTAKRVFEQSMHIRENAFGNQSLEFVHSLLRLGQLHLEHANATEAASYFKKAIFILGETPGNVDTLTVQALVGHGKALLVERQIEEALNILQQAQQIQLNKLGEHELETARVYSTHAEALIANGKCGEATTMMRRSHELLDRHLLRQLTLPEYTDFERQKLVARLSGSTSRSVSLSLDASQPCSGMVGIAFEAVLRRKARAAETQTMLFAQLRRNMTPDDQEVLNSYIQAVTEASMQALKGQVKEPQSVVTKGHRLPEKGYLEQGVAARSLRFATQKAEVSLSAIQSALPSDSVLVEFVQFELSQFPWKSPNGSDETNYAAFVMTSEGKIHRVNLGPKDLIDAQIHQLRKAIGDCPNEGGACPNSLTNTRTEARKLYQQVWAPLLPFLSNASHALISPDGNLNLLPFAALVAPEGPYLLEEMRLTYLSSARDLLRLNKSSRVRGHSAIIAAPAFGNGGQSPDRTNANQSSLGPIEQPGQLQRLRWPALPGTGKEANIIQGLLQQPQVALGAKATETFLKELQGPFILHIATHGYFLGGSEISGDRGIRLVPTGDGQEKLPALSDPGLNSGLVLAGGSGLEGDGQNDGIATAREVALLDLWGTRMVVLSGCETGVGDIQNGEGVMGLRRAVAVAGAETQVLSLWKVADEATVQLMEEFYVGLAAELGRSEALRRSAQRMLADTRFKHPYFWAAFVLSGDWRPLNELR